MFQSEINCVWRMCSFKLLCLPENFFLSLKLTLGLFTLDYFLLKAVNICLACRTKIKKNRSHRQKKDKEKECERRVEMSSGFQESCSRIGRGGGRLGVTLGEEGV